MAVRNVVMIPANVGKPFPKLLIIEYGMNLGNKSKFRNAMKQLLQPAPAPGTVSFLHFLVLILL